MEEGVDGRNGRQAIKVNSIITSSSIEEPKVVCMLLMAELVIGVGVSVYVPVFTASSPNVDELIPILVEAQHLEVANYNMLDFMVVSISVLD